MIIIIGKGPAGISAALYTKRAGIDTLVIGEGKSALYKAEKIENYYGFSEPISGKELLENGIMQAKRIGVEVLETQVVGIGYADKGYTIATTNGTFDADVVIFATGSNRNTPRIKGIKEFEGKGISYCAVCDGFFYKGRNVAVIGDGEYAVREATELAHIVGSVTILTNGKDMTTQVPDGILVDTRKIQEITGDEIIDGVIFDDGQDQKFSGIFVAVGVASSVDLAKKLGARTEANKLVVNDAMQTNLPGIYGVGDCIGGLLQVSKAVSDGAIAGTDAVRYIRQLG